MNTAIKDGVTEPFALQRGEIYVQHDPDSNHIDGIWFGDKATFAKVIAARKQVRPGNGVSYAMNYIDGYVGADTNGGVATITLPSTDKLNNGHVVIIKDEGGLAGTNNITIDTPGTETTDVASIATNGGIARLLWDFENQNWIDVS